MYNTIQTAQQRIA